MSNGGFVKLLLDPNGSAHLSTLYNGIICLILCLSICQITLDNNSDEKKKLTDLSLRTYM